MDQTKKTMKHGLLFYTSRDAVLGSFAQASKALGAEGACAGDHMLPRV